MSLNYKSKNIALAKTLRKQATPQENHLWYDFLRRYPVRFQRQKAIDCYIVDFYCHQAKLVIEIDGTQHFEEGGQEYDAMRTMRLEELGLQVIRISNRQINEEFDRVCAYIDCVVTNSLSHGVAVPAPSEREPSPESNER
ncbi:MAG: endonuclease domain-containing protein [Ruminococcaceae bacterium]|nr:endonuclease domain-containing protein [Oscillospiraceae bacterium]